ncbi:DUF4145 domain-containing protein [Wohlfahrtiimonas populi]|uniref:DUF4145 domain-containing protein n=1 Tax=Wohlfahrtiimonas populi TaxID=1940240 RepID=UPI001E65C1D8|nr:DUF4145 domain-containing protein [Wohlfahrtiimonas populi]
MSNKLLCPACNTNIPINTSHAKIILRYPKTNTENDESFITLSCYHCDQLSIWDCREAPDVFHVVYPSAITAEPAHPDMPEEIKVDFEEARKIAKDSPRGAAALLRLCLQNLLIHIGSPGKTIDKDISFLVKEDILPRHLQQACDTLRVLGNNAVHPDKIGLNLQDNKDIVHALFKLVNLLIQEKISNQKEIESLYNLIPKNLQDAINKRDDKNTSE